MSFRRFALKSFSVFLRSKNMEHDPTKLSKTQLAEILPRYYEEVRRYDGSMYSYNTIVNIRYTLSNYFRTEHPDRIDILKDREFRHAEEVVIEQLRKILHRNKPEVDYPITANDVEQIEEAFRFPFEPRKTLAMKVWFDLTRYLGNQTALPQSQWTCDMLKVFFDPSRDSFYVTWSTPNADGQEYRMYETKTDGCPVSNLTKYITKLNPANSMVFQKIGTYDGHIWYGPETMGQEKLDRMMVSISEMSSLWVKYTNRSVTGSVNSSLYRPRVQSQCVDECCEEITFDDYF